MTHLVSLALRALGPALLVSALTLPAPASAQPYDADWSAELDWIAATAAELDGEGRADAALELLEGMPTAALVDDRDATRRMIRVAGSLHAPGAEPEWFYAGVPLAIAGAVGLLVTGIANAVATSCGWFATACVPPDPDMAPFIAGYVLAGGAVLVGLILNIIGLANHTADPDRRAFERRRSDVIRGFVDARRGIGVRW